MKNKPVTIISRLKEKLSTSTEKIQKETDEILNLLNEVFYCEFFDSYDPSNDMKHGFKESGGIYFKENFLLYNDKHKAGEIYIGDDDMQAMMAVYMKDYNSRPDTIGGFSILVSLDTLLPMSHFESDECEDLRSELVRLIEEIDKLKEEHDRFLKEDN